MKTKLKKGDNVIVITGKDKGKKGTIVSLDPIAEKVLVEGINIKKKNIKAKNGKKGKEKGEIIEKPFPIHISNVMILDPKSNTKTRIAIKQTEKGRVRIAKKSGKEIA